jgi:WD40 repeat protein
MRLGLSSPLGMLALLAGMSGPSAVAATTTVEVADGNIFVLDGAQRRQVTRSGRDAEPVLAPDGKTIVFTRVGNPKSSGMQGDCKSGAQADELRRVRVEGTGDELLVRGQEGKDPKDSICEFRRKQFSSDGRYLFSLTPAWATSGALHVYDTRDKKLSFVMPANDVIVLSACKSADYRDNLVVQQHRYFVVAGSYDWYWLYDRTGKKEKGPVGDYDGEQAVREAIEAAGLCER